MKRTDVGGLRIGNMLRYKGEYVFVTGIYQLDGVWFIDFTDFDKYSSDEVGEFDFVLVSDSILDCFGFVKDGLYMSKKKFSVRTNGCRCVFEFAPKIYNQLTYPKYTHELQNLFYITTKKELVYEGKK